MGTETPKPHYWLSRFVSSLSWVLPVLTLNPLNQSSNGDQQHHVETDEPESSSISVYISENQDDSQDQLHESTMSNLEPENRHTPIPKLEDELSSFSQADMETQDELGITNSIPSYPQLPLSILERFDSSSSSSSETFYQIRGDSNGAESAPPSPTPSIESPIPFYYHMQTTAPLDLEYSPTEDTASSSFDSFSTKSSSRGGANISPPEPSTTANQESPNPKNSTLIGLHSSPPQPSTATKQSSTSKNSTLVGVHSSPPQPPTTTKQNPNPKISRKVEKLQSNEVGVLISSTKEQKADYVHPVLEIIDKQEHGKHVLVLAIPMLMALVVTSNPLSKTVEMQVVAVVLCCAFAAIWNGILLRKIYRTASTLLLVGGIALIMLAFYAFVGCFLPLKLKWIPGLSWLASLFPAAKVLLAFFRQEVAGEENDLEKGKINNDKPCY